MTDMTFKDNLPCCDSIACCLPRIATQHEILATYILMGQLCPL